MPLAVVLTFLLAQPLAAPGGVRAVELQLATGTQVQVSALDDGFNVGLWLGTGEPDKVRRALARLDPARVRLLAPSGKEVGALITFDVPVKSARVSQKAAHPGTIRLEVDLEDPIAALAEHVFDEPLPLPVSLEARTLREADALLQTHHVAEAVLLLQRLEHAYPLRAWVLLRLGDVALVDGQLNEACGLWQDAIANGRERVSARLARLRGFVADCKLTEAPEWAVMLGREGRDDPVGRQSALEASWALSYTTRIPIIRHVLELGHAHKSQPLPPELEHALIARLVRMGSPFEVASLLAEIDIRKHPEGFDLALIGAAARCALDIPNTQAPEGEQRATRSWMQLSPAKKYLWRRRAGACQLMDAGDRSAWPEETLLASRTSMSASTTPSAAPAQDSNDVPAAAAAAKAGAAATPPPAAAPASAARNIVVTAASDPLAHLTQLGERIRHAQQALGQARVSGSDTPQTSHDSSRGLP